jgi:hypothetical protein
VLRQYQPAFRRQHRENEGSRLRGSVVVIIWAGISASKAPLWQRGSGGSAAPEAAPAVESWLVDPERKPSRVPNRCFKKILLTRHFAIAQLDHPRYGGSW